MVVYTANLAPTVLIYIMKSTKVQTLGGIWRKYGLKTPFHAYVTRLSMKNEL